MTKTQILIQWFDKLGNLTELQDIERILLFSYFLFLLIEIFQLDHQ